LYLKSVFVINY